MPALADGQITNLALYAAMVLTVFVIARLLNARPAIAWSIAALPVLVAMAFANPMLHGMLLASFGS